MFTGQPPFRGQTAVEVALKHVNERPPALAELRPDLPPGIVSLVERMMSKDPARRPQSGRDVLRELNQPGGPATESNPFANLTGSADQATSSMVEVGRAMPPARSSWKRWLPAAFAVAILGMAGMGLKLFVNAHSSPTSREDHPNLPVVSNQERQILSAIELSKGLNTPDKVRYAAGLHVELGVLYWEQKRYGDAERLFEDMAKKPNAPVTFRIVSSLGLGVTYALRDEVDRSNKQFLESRSPTPAGKPIPPLFPPQSLPTEDAINLRYWVLTALDRNATRPPAAKEIDDLRQQLRRRPNLGGSAKPG
jgi:serine/threonine-protein kinase